MNFPPLKKKKYPNSSQVSFNRPLCIWNKEGIERFKAPDGVELDFIAKNTHTQQLEHGGRLGRKAGRKTNKQKAVFS